MSPRIQRFLQEASRAGMLTFPLHPEEVRTTLETQELLKGKGVCQSSPLPQTLFPDLPQDLAPEEADYAVAEGLWGVAETGSVILGPPRRLTLVPDRLIILLAPNRIVQTLPEALARLNPQQVSAYVLLQGPSVTADIEKKIVRGVHGPREVILILLLE